MSPSPATFKRGPTHTNIDQEINVSVSCYLQTWPHPYKYRSGDQCLRLLLSSNVAPPIQILIRRTMSLSPAIFKRGTTHTNIDQENNVPVSCYLQMWPHPYKYRSGEQCPRLLLPSNVAPPIQILIRRTMSPSPAIFKRGTTHTNKDQENNVPVSCYLQTWPHPYKYRSGDQCLRLLLSSNVAPPIQI